MGDIYADIIVDISHEKLDRPFQYRVPPALAERLEAGMRVQIPFGNGNKQIQGYVIDIGETCKFDPERTKDITGILSGGVGVEENQIALAAFLRRNYGSTMIQALKTVLPAKQKVAARQDRIVERAMDREALISLLGQCERKKQLAKARLLRELLGAERIPYSFLTGKLNIPASTIQGLARAGALRIVSRETLRNPVRLLAERDCAKPLSEEQNRVVEEVLGDLDGQKAGTYVLHGITGSGKTEVYLQLAAGVVERGKQAIILIPEIALTYQTLLRFYKRFGDRVSVMNSTLSPGEKYDQCERAKRGEIDVIIGPRSALFVPFPAVGLIVIDEEHEPSYKSDLTPKYHARETALEVARLHGACVVLGSATPSLEAYYRAQTGEYRLYSLTKRLTGGSLPAVHVVDLRRELREGNRSIFSRKLQGLLADRLGKGQQSILFLNRRGYAGFISCRACGHVMKCPHCDVSLSEHQDGTLHCHYCGYREPKPARCPSCGSQYILGFRAGTQQIEEKLKALFPGVRTLRMDADTTRTKESYQQILSAFANEEADVLIGTQMIVKGHDFPKVTLVGVLAADLSLCLGDYRAGERTFQLLTQAVGRAGRGEMPGEAVIQTYQPEHYAVSYAANQDYEGFYQEELLYRELGGYPPVRHMLAVQLFARQEEAGRTFAERLCGRAREVAADASASIIGPAAASIGRIHDIFRFVFYVKASKYDILVLVKDELEQNLNDWDEKNVSVQFDFDPVNGF